MPQNSLKCVTTQYKSVKTLGKEQYIHQALINRLRYAIHWEFWTLCNCWLIDEYCRSVLRQGFLNHSYVDLKNLIWRLIGKLLYRCLQIRTQIMCQWGNISLSIIDLQRYISLIKCGKMNLLANRKIFNRSCKISIFKSKTKSRLLRSSEFLKIWHYLLQECKHFRQRARY